MSRLGIPVSVDTLIRQVKRAAHPPALPQVRVLGVDDWAWRKGQTFGTILVDLERSQVLLPTSSADSLSPTTKEAKSRSEPIRVRSSVMMQQMEVARQRRQQKLELFRTIKQMRAAGMKVSQIARQLGLCRRRIDKWIHLDELPERSRMQPRSGMPESFRDYLRQRWEEGCRHGRTRIGGDSEARLRRLLLGTGKIPFAVAPGKGRDPKGGLKVPRSIAS
jgi:hypothetical protein